MKSLIIYCSKTGNTHKVAQRIARGLGGEADIVRLDVSPEGVMKEFHPGFTWDVAPYDLVCLGAWVMVMKVHPTMAAYIEACKNLDGKKVAAFLTGGAIFSRNHAYEDLTHLLGNKKAKLIQFHYTTTLLGLTLTRRKLQRAEQFGRELRLTLEQER
jgi:flavodoxin